MFQNVLNDIPFSFSAGEKIIFKARKRKNTLDWAIKNMRLIDGPLKGQLWNIDLAPHAKGIFKAFDSKNVRVIIFAAPSQVGKTVIGIAGMGACLCQDLDNMGIGMPNEISAKETFQNKLHNFFIESPALSNLLRDKESLLAKEIKLKGGAVISAMYAGSETSMRSKAMRYVFIDEPDAYEEKSALKIMQERVDAYYGMGLSKVYISSKPKGKEDESVTWEEMQHAGAFMKYYAVCPYCKAPQVMEHENIKSYDNTRDRKRIRDEKLARYECVHCHKLWNDTYRNIALRDGFWLDEKKIEQGLRARPNDFGNATIVAFHLRSWESPLVSLSEVLADWFEAQGNPRRLQNFDNNRCAKPYKFVKLETDWQKLEPCIDYGMQRGVLPEFTKAVTLSIDTQLDHFYYSFAAHGVEPFRINKIEHGVVRTFEDVLVLLQKRFLTESGREFGIWRAVIDTGGGREQKYEDSRTTQVYKFLLEYGNRFPIFGTKGMSRARVGVTVDLHHLEKLPSGKRLNRGLKLYLLDTDSLKRMVWYSLFEGHDIEPLIFDADTDEEYLRQMSSEKLIENKFGKEEWVKVYRNNHYWDTMVGHFAMAHWQFKPSLEELVKINDRVQREHSEANKAAGSSFIRERGTTFLQKNVW